MSYHVTLTLASDWLMGYVVAMEQDTHRTILEVTPKMDLLNKPSFVNKNNDSIYKHARSISFNLQ